ncbi:carbamoyl-phosphate synthase large subunit [Peribacillus simplex]|uniref:carbamoyl-phosphate synthase large subunit n=1 Tax=Peribacillus simplex TaxID=1478 RepID=UPI003D2A7A83
MDLCEKTKKILVIGSGPIVIGQAAEFDYSGTQACQSLKEEGYTVLLANSNPATIMTDELSADKVYMEPLTTDFITKIIEMERPDAILPTLGGQTALNLAVDLENNGVLLKYNVELLGVTLDTIKKAEDRKLFKELMCEINEPVPVSCIANSIEEAVIFSKENNFPLIVRPAYTLGGTGGGLCNNEEELIKITRNGLSLSPINQCLIERSIAGFKEIEFEVIRDSRDQAIVVCSMENFDPVGIHTGDSIVVAPSQTLTNQEYRLLRESALKIIRKLEIKGGCNVQFALDPYSQQYYVIEVNPRVSRSSALASKATGYPIAKISSKIAVGKRLDEIINPVTGTTFACYEPTLDYVVTKIPNFPSEKFGNDPGILSTQMRATGEVMAIGRTFEESLMKGIRSISKKYEKRWLGLSNIKTEEILNRLSGIDHQRIFFIAEAFRRGIPTEEIYEKTKIDRFYLSKIQKIVHMESIISNNKFSRDLTIQAKKSGISDLQLSILWKVPEQKVFNWRVSSGIMPVYKMVDTCAAEFESKTPYFYSSYESFNESIVSKRKKILLLGSGPIQIGQGIEFDYATVHSVQAIQECGYESIIINNNPETVSTDFSVSDKLYFEPLTIEDIMNIVHLENPFGVIVQFGGQAAINLANKLNENGVKILGTSVESIECGENRGQFEKLLTDLNLNHPIGYTVYDSAEALRVTRKVNYPVIVRPSYVIGGSDMCIINNRKELDGYLKNYNFTFESPLYIDRYIEGTELELDAISDGKSTFIPGVIEQIEQSGVHSGDSIAVYPPQTVSREIQEELSRITNTIAKSLNVKGLMNIQAVLSENHLFILEINLRASRTVPFMSKIKGIPLAKVATKCQLGIDMEDICDISNEINDSRVYVKVPVFSFNKISELDPLLGPEMKSTGEVIGYDETLTSALYKGFIGSGMIPNMNRRALLLVAGVNNKVIEVAYKLKLNNFEIITTKEIAQLIKPSNIPLTIVDVQHNATSSIIESLLKNREIDIVINNIQSDEKDFDNSLIRRQSIIYGITCITHLDTANILLDVLNDISLASRRVNVDSFYKRKANSIEHV